MIGKWVDIWNSVVSFGLCLLSLFLSLTETWPIHSYIALLLLDVKRRPDKMREVLEEYSEQFLESLIKFIKLGNDDINNEKVSPFAEVQSKTVFDMVAQMYKLIIILMFKTKIRVKKYSINPCQYI
jgi:hypothetical protein